MLFSLYINDITTDIDSEIRLFADDCVCREDTVKLQADIDRLGKEMGHEIPTSQFSESQMQYHADYKQADQCFL